MRALCFMTLAVVSGLALWYVELINYPLGLLIVIVIPNAVIQERALIKMIKEADYDRHMTDSMKYADLQMLLFGLIPLRAFSVG